MARPAASADVQPSGRRALVCRSKHAPDPAVHLRAVPAEVEELVEQLVVLVDNQHVAIAAGDSGCPARRLRSSTAA